MINSLHFQRTVCTCADQESFARGGPTLTGFFGVFFKLMKGGRIQIPL